MHAQRTPGLLLLGLCTLTVSGCGASANKEASEAAATQLYQSVAAKDWDKVLAHYGPEFFQVMPRDVWRTTLISVGDRLGEYRSHRLEGWSYNTTTDAEGTRQVTELTFKVQYGKGEATENLTFLRRGEGAPLRIIGHKITSPLLAGLGP
jgi:hypothetical protein